MKKLAIFSFCGLLAAAGWMFSDKFQIKGLDQFRLVPRQGRTGRSREPGRFAGLR